MSLAHTEYEPITPHHYMPHMQVTQSICQTKRNSPPSPPTRTQDFFLHNFEFKLHGERETQ